MRRLFPVLFFMCALLLPVGMAQAATGWGPATTLSTDNCRTYYPQIVAVGAADATGMWMRDDPCGQANYIQQTASLTGDTWGESSTMPASANAGPANLASDGLGNVWAVWSEFDGGTQIVSLVVARRDSTGAWGAPQVLDSAGNSSIRGGPVAANTAGAAIVLWGKDVGGVSVTHAYRYTPAGGWSTGTAISEAGTATYAQRVVLDDEGRATATWSRKTGSNPDTFQVQSRVAGADGAWGATRDFGSTSGFALAGPLVQTADGAVTYLSIVDRAPAADTLTVHRKTTGDWDQGAVISDGDNVLSDETFPDLAIRPDGSAVAVWVNGVDIFNGPYIARAARSSSDGRWAAPQTLSGNAEVAFLPKVVTDAVGNDLAVWGQASTIADPFVVVAARAPLGGAWTPIAGPGNEYSLLDLDLALSGNGQAHVLMQEDVTDQVWERVRGVSWTPPAPRVVTRPRISGTVREGKTLRVDDGAWSEVATVEHRWQRCANGIRYRCRTVTGATGPTYRVTSADRGYALRVVSRASGVGGTSGFAATAMTRTFSKLTVRRVARGRNGVRVRVRVSGAGRIDVRGFVGNARRASCVRIVRVKRARYATLTCRLRTGVRSRLVGRTPSLRVVITYRPTRGVARRVIQRVDIGPVTRAR